MDNRWLEFIDAEKEKDYFIKLNNFLQQEQKNFTIYPSSEEIYRAFELCNVNDIKVVIVGQDPYHGENEANGLAFSIYEGNRIPPSLRNIFKELEADLGIKRTNVDLSDWAKQGVFLLNTVLTVRKDNARSHSKQGWEIFTDEVIKYLNNLEQPIVYILWGKDASLKKSLINNKNHHIIESVHPSPLSASRGFFGSKPFSETNDFLIKNNIEIIKW